MAAIDTRLVAERRSKFGTAESRRLRRRGVIPGNVYGHQQDPVSIAVSEETLEKLVHGGARVVDLEIDGSAEKAMFREVQWDTFGVKIRHFDLLRVDPNERVTLDVGLELRGTAPGSLAGGVLEQQLRSLSVECLAYQIPETIVVRISHLEIGQTILVRDLELPDSVNVLTPEEAAIVHIGEPVEIEEAEEAAMEEGAQPEVIGRKPEEEEEASK